MQKPKSKLKRLNTNSDLAIILALVFGIPLALICILDLYFLGGTVTKLSMTAVDLFMSGVLISNLISGSSYIGRTLEYIGIKKTIIDVFAFIASPLHKIFKSAFTPSKRHSNFNIKLRNPSDAKFKKPTREPTGKYEKALTVAGVVIGLSLGITLVALSGGNLNQFIFFLDYLPNVVSTPLFTVICAGISGGFLARIGRTTDQVKKHGWKGLNQNHWLAIIGAIVGGIAVTVLDIMLGGNVTTTMELCKTIFLSAALTSTMLSGASYSGRALDFMFGGKTIIHFFSKFCSCFKKSNKQTINSQTQQATQSDTQKTSTCCPQRPNNETTRLTNEKIATIVGVLTGLAIGLTIIALTGGTGGIFMPFFLKALPATIKMICFVMTFIGSFGSFGTRIGRTIDHTYRAGEERTVLHWLKDKFRPEPTRKSELTPISKLNFRRRRKGLLRHTSTTRRHPIYTRLKEDSSVKMQTLLQTNKPKIKSPKPITTLPLPTKQNIETNRNNETTIPTSSLINLPRFSSTTTHQEQPKPQEKNPNKLQRKYSPKLFPQTTPTKSDNLPPSNLVGKNRNSSYQPPTESNDLKPLPSPIIKPLNPKHRSLITCASFN